MSELSTQICCLCQNTLPRDPIKVDGTSFCCHGCQAVYAILSLKGELQGYQEHPLFFQAMQAGLISNPTLLLQIDAKTASLNEEEKTKFYFEAGGMWCPSCAELIRLVLLQEKGVKSCHIDYATDLGVIEFAPRYLSKQSIFQKIEALGYRPQLLENRQQTALSKDLIYRFGIAAFCALNAMMFAYPLYATYLDGGGDQYDMTFGWISFFLSLPVIFYSGRPIFSHCWSSLKIGIVGMEALVTLGVFAAFALSTVQLFSEVMQVYYDSMTVIIAFVLLGKIIESKAKFSAKESLFRLNLSLPKRGRKQLANGNFAYMPIKELQQGDRLEVRLGETIVLDGKVVEGTGICNEALMTGESMPVVKKEGSKVIGGTLLQHGHLIVEVEATSTQTALQCIVDIIEKQMQGKAAYLRPADKIAAWFVPFVLCVAACVVFFCWFFSITTMEAAWLRGIAVLLIACPCAIGIAAPVAESYLIHALAGLGAIVRNRDCLRYLGRETVMIFDKTGTITEGKFSVRKGIENLTHKQKSILKSLVDKSNHPIAQAVSRALEGCEGSRLQEVQEVTGKGIQGYFNGTLYLLGSSRFLREQGMDIDDVQEEDEISTCVYFGKKGGNPIVIVLGDQLKQGIVEVIASLKSIKTILVSGDRSKCVAYVAAMCGIPQWEGQALPLEKRQIVERWIQRGETVGFIGDGVNDSPALATAHVNISVATAADVSAHVSDILLTTDHLSILPKIRLLANKGRRIIGQNLFWAFFYNIVGVFLAITGWLTPLFAAFAMTASSLIVLFNAMRLKK